MWGTEKAGSNVLCGRKSLGFQKMPVAVLFLLHGRDTFIHIFSNFERE
jgi:hypothetical protein